MGKNNDSKLEAIVDIGKASGETQKAENKEDKKFSKKGILFSRLDYAEKFTYNNEESFITPKGKISIDDVSKVKTPLAKGLTLRSI